MCRREPTPDASKRGGGTFLLASVADVLYRLRSHDGHVAEWLRNVLQNRVPLFNYGRGHQQNQKLIQSPYFTVTLRQRTVSEVDPSIRAGVTSTPPPSRRGREYC